MSRVIVHLPPTEIEALRRLAERNFRDPRAQAALFIRQALQQAGELAPAALAGQSQEAAHVNA
jgi:hypothetical protein